MVPASLDLDPLIDRLLFFRFFFASVKMRAGGDWGCVGSAAQVRVEIELNRGWPKLPNAYAK